MLTRPSLFLLLAVLGAGSWSTGAAEPDADAATEVVAAAEGVQLPPMLACAVDFRRHFDVDHGDWDPAQLQALSDGDADLVVESEITADGTLRLRLKPGSIGVFPLRIVERSSGQVLATSVVRSFELSSSASRLMPVTKRIATDSVITSGDLIMRPLIPGLEVRVVPIARMLAVPNGLREQWLETDMFRPCHLDGSGRGPYHLWKGPDAAYLRHTYITLQDGVQVSGRW